MCRIEILPAADAELDALYEEDENAAAVFDELLIHLDEDKDMCGRLFRPAHHFNYSPAFDIGKFAQAQKRGLNIFRIKVRDNNGSWIRWRLFIAHHARIDVYYVLSVCPREHAYDINHATFQQLCDRYAESDCPVFKC